jgi:aminoglycoside phosphotransferase (APT) family kinase protein
MAIDLAELPDALAKHVPRHAKLSYPPQGMTAEVAFAEHAGRTVLVKRCANPIYIDWLRREQLVLRALRASGLPVPRFIAYAETDLSGSPVPAAPEIPFGSTETATPAPPAVGWLVTSVLAGRPVFGVALESSPSARESLFRSVGALLKRLHATPIPAELRYDEPWMERQLRQARVNLSWCDGTEAGLAVLEKSRPEPVPETLIHGDMALDNALVDEAGKLSLVDWAGGGPGDPRIDIALALQTKPELELSAAALAAFFEGYGTAPVDERTRAWFVDLYDYF